jgi:putative DNA primase/helicase
MRNSSSSTTHLRDGETLSDLDQAERFLSILDPGATAFTFQTFDDDKERAKELKKAKKKNPRSRIRNGALTDHLAEFAELQADRGGIFITINRTDGLGRAIKDIVSVRALVVDLDGAPLDPVFHDDGNIPPPTIVTETSPNKFQCWWLVDDLELEEFTALQKMLAERFGGDPSVHDLPRVMRLPGFIHQKGEPHMVRIVHADEKARYKAKVFRDMRPSNGQGENADSFYRERAGEGISFDPDDLLRSSPWQKLNQEAMTHLDAWVPELFGKDAVIQGSGGYRVSSAALGRDLEEDLSISPKGIVDFGIADQADEREGRRSPIDVVMEYSKPTRTRGQAVEWLSKKLGVESGTTVELLGPRPPFGPGSASRRLPPPSVPMAVARAFASKFCTHEGQLTLYNWRGGWWQWRTSHWSELEDREVRSSLYDFTENAFYVHVTDGKSEMKPWAPNRHKIGDVIDALIAVCLLRGDVDQPSWLDRREMGIIVSVRNGLLDVKQRCLIPHTPQFFNQTSVPFDYDADAPRPQRWHEFLKKLWPNEDSAIDLLGEWFGYVISGRLDLHKILLMVGPTRGGKGIIARILGALLGGKNVAGPTLNSFAGMFGLESLIGKPLAVISDVRFVSKDHGIVVERLLSISGEDTLTVERKYRRAWTGKLPTRLHMISNELPRLSDASGAIVGRLLLLLLEHSWIGKEDFTLETNLQPELTGILNWALTGLKRLVDNQNRFTRVESADDAIITMRDLASPVGAFVRQMCKIDPDGKIETDKLYRAYKSWCDDNGHVKAAKAVFGRNLHAVVPSVIKERPREGDSRIRYYAGINLIIPPESGAARPASEEEPL